MAASNFQSKNQGAILQPDPDWSIWKRSGSNQVLINLNIFPLAHILY